MRWQEVNPDLRLETLQEEGLLSVAPMAVDDKVALLAIVFRLRLREEHLTELKKGHLVARLAGTAYGELLGLEVFVI